jgi:exonuclease III
MPMPMPTPTPTRSTRRLAIAAAALAPLALLPACNKPASHSKLGVLDGSLADWPADTAQWTDDRYLYLRLSPPDLVTLQSSDEPLALYLDADGDASTGAVPPAVNDGSRDRLGADLVIVFSPGTAFGRLTDKPDGVVAAVIYADGSMREVSSADLDFSFSPTYAASEYEMRISRAGLASVLGVPVVARSAASRFETLSAAGLVTGASDAARGMEVVSGAEPAAVEGVPARADGAVRLVSWNVERGGPNGAPDPFARVLCALAPDVVAVQEWDGVTAEQLAAWFDEHLSWGAPWHAMTSDARGVAVVSRYELDRLGPQRLEHPADAPADAWNREHDGATRFAGAVVKSPLGPMAVGSVHLKCCGSMGSREDLARVAEANQIRETFASAADARGVTLRVIAGDFNLVGSRSPLDAMSSGGDADRTGMAHADPRVLGDTTLVTWFDPGSNFTPGRLDWVLYGASTLEVQRSFVLDTARLGCTACRAAGLHERDSRVSDHMPVVTDFVGR